MFGLVKPNLIQMSFKIEWTNTMALTGFIFDFCRHSLQLTIHPSCALQHNVPATTCNIHCSISILGSTSVADILHKLVSERDFNKVFQNSFSMAYESGNFFISEPCLCLWRFERFDHDALFTTFIIPSLCIVSTLFFISMAFNICVFYTTIFFFCQVKA